MNLISVYYQIRDDYLNLKSADYASKKGFAEDLTEGKFSFPIIHAIRADPTNTQLINILQQRPSTPTIKQYAIDYMEERTHSLTYTLHIMHTLDHQAREEIRRLGGNRLLEVVLDALKVKDLGSPLD